MLLMNETFEQNQIRLYSEYHPKAQSLAFWLRQQVERPGRRTVERGLASAQADLEPVKKEVLEHLTEHQGDYIKGALREAKADHAEINFAGDWAAEAVLAEQEAESTEQSIDMSAM